MNEGLGGTGPVHLSEAKETRRVMAMGLEMQSSEWGQEHLKISHQSRLYHIPPHGTREPTRNLCGCKVEKTTFFSSARDL